MGVYVEGSSSILRPCLKYTYVLTETSYQHNKPSQLNLETLGARRFAKCDRGRGRARRVLYNGISATRDYNTAQIPGRFLTSILLLCEAYYSDWITLRPLMRLDMHLCMDRVKGSSRKRYSSPLFPCGFIRYAGLCQILMLTPKLSVSAIVFTV